MSVLDAPRRLELPSGAALAVVQTGAGDPVVFVHGGGKDLRYWRRQVAPFSAHFRVVAYSRRHSWPHLNPPPGDAHSPRVDAEDLGALLDALALGPAHVVAASVGGVAALALALERPGAIRSLVLAEPPVLPLADATPGGAAMRRDFVRGVFDPAAARFRAGDADGAMRGIVDGFLGAGTFDGLHARARGRVLENARDWEAHVRSEEPFPALSRERLAALRIPVLMLTGTRTTPLHRVVDDALADVLPDVRRVVVEGATHDLWADEPEGCREAVLGFLRERRTRE
ncbi:alpha/beta hydrolase [Roseisolibacter sp. H3M3-2]|uniref:alpha/beta fold hydrolase n=1 Tax=Roseisolibacter sp. H3M3-2 TaxID=3031323 RepID=UPI0023DAF50D|nr:alpha/beta hydrolase [Roseisolibacter sp. H3M3-2]MDF1503560.1 alpha/beta hydrolase [Roseisolibacter sp. H3M3-2]